MPNRKHSLPEAIQTLCLQKKLTLSLAESCTGGALASSFTVIPGCSAYFIGSLVAYSNKLKINALGVNPEDLEKFGAVSKEVVSQMAIGMLKLTQSDFSLAVSGIAGPTGGTDEKPVGTIWAAICQQNQNPFVWSFFVKGSRSEIIEKTVEIILTKFLELVE